MGLYKEIEGEKISLRPITGEDTDCVVKWRNNENVSKNFIYREKFTREIHENWLKTKVETGDTVQYIIEEKGTNGEKTPVGSVYMRDIDQTHQSAEFGIFIGEDTARGKGYGTEATRLFVKFGFEELGLHRIFLRVIHGNTAALETYRKVGFEQEGLFRDMVKIQDRYYDIVFMSIINSKK